MLLTDILYLCSITFLWYRSNPDFQRLQTVEEEENKKLLKILAWRHFLGTSGHFTW